MPLNTWHNNFKQCSKSGCLWSALKTCCSLNMNFFIHLFGRFIIHSPLIFAEYSTALFRDNLFLRCRVSRFTFVSVLHLLHVPTTNSFLSDLPSIGENKWQQCSLKDQIWPGRLYRSEAYTVCGFNPLGLELGMTQPEACSNHEKQV